MSDFREGLFSCDMKMWSPIETEQLMMETRKLGRVIHTIRGRNTS